MNKFKTTIATGLILLATTGCQNIRPTRDSSGRLTGSAIRAMEADIETQQRLQRNTNYETTSGIHTYGIQFR